MRQETNCTCLKIDNEYLRSHTLSDLAKFKNISLVYDQLSHNEILHAVSLVGRLNLSHIVYHFLLTANNSLVSSHNANSITLDIANLFDILFSDYYPVDTYDLCNSRLLSEFVSNVNMLYEALEPMLDKGISSTSRENIKNTVVDLVVLILEALLVDLFAHIPDFDNQIYVFNNATDNSLSFVIVT